MKLRLRGFAPSYRSRYEIGSNRKEKKNENKPNQVISVCEIKVEVEKIS